MDQWSGLHTSTSGDTGLNPGWGTKIPLASRCGQKHFCVSAFYTFFRLFLAALGLHCCTGLSLVMSRGRSGCGAGPLAAVTCCRVWALEHVGISRRGTWARWWWLPDSRARSQQVWHMGLVVPRHVGFSQTRN